MRHLFKIGRIVKDFLIAVGDRIGRVMTVILLCVLYCTVVAFVWLIAKIFRKKFMDLRFGTMLGGRGAHDVAPKSYWIHVDEEFNTHTLEKWEAPY